MAKIFLLTGISGSGKTTIGLKLFNYMKKDLNLRTEFIDGDVVREFFGNEHGYSYEERNIVTKQIAFAANMLAKNGINVIVANIAGNYKIRDFLREKWTDYVQIFLDADIDDCKKNDPKGLYAKTSKQDNPNVYGCDLEYQKPRNPDIVLYPYKESLEESFCKLKDYLSKIDLGD